MCTYVSISIVPKVKSLFGNFLNKRPQGTYRVSSQVITSYPLGLNMKQRWLRISLRTTLVAFTVLCVSLGWYVYRVGKQQTAARWILENRGQVVYAFENETQLSDSRSPSFVPKWLFDVLGADYFSSVTEVNGLQTDLSDIAPLAALTKLEILNLDDTQVTDLTPLANLTELVSLSLSNTPVQNVKPLAGLTKLEGLYLDGTHVSDLSPLEELTNLEELFLFSTQVSDAKPLAGMTELLSLSLANTKVSDIRPLTRLTKLECLRLDPSEVHDVRPLAGLTQLRILSLAFTQVSDVSPLAKLSNLRELHLNNAQVGEEQMKELQNALPKCVINKRDLWVNGAPINGG